MTWLCSTIIVHYEHIFWFTWLALVLVLCVGSYLTLRLPLDCSCISIHFFYLHLSPLAHYLTHIFKLMWCGSLFFWQCLTSSEDCSFHVHILVGLSHLFPCAPHAIVLHSRATFPSFVEFCSFIISDVRVHLLPLTLDGPTTIIQIFALDSFLRLSTTSQWISLFCLSYWLLMGWFLMISQLCLPHLFWWLAL